MTAGTEKYLLERGLVKQEKNLYHYTSVDALKKIMDKNILLATHMQYMNDWSEYEQGYEKLIRKLNEIIERSDKIFDHDEYEVLRQKVKELPEKCPKTPKQYRDFIVERNRTHMEKLLPEVYSVSFCKQSNLLSQWINYAKENGVCIEFDFSAFVFICPDVTEEMIELFGEKNIEKYRVYTECSPIQVVYDEKVMLSVMENDISAYFQRVVGKDKTQIEEQWWAEMGNVFSIVPFFKDSSFCPEEEVRLAVRPICVALNYQKPQNGRLSGMFEAKICHMESDHVMKPRLRLQWRKKDGCVGHTPIKAITVGPGSNMQMAYQSIIHYIEYELNNIPVIDEVERKKLEIAETVRSGETGFEEPYVTNKGIVVRKSNIPYIF